MSSDFHKNHHVASSSSFRSQEKTTSANNNTITNITENNHKNNNNNNAVPSNSHHTNKPLEKVARPTTIQKNLWGSRSVDVFEKIEAIGEGTFGYV